jgi:rhodanese-related sulfurtransferase
MPTVETINVLAKYPKPNHHLLVLNKADAPFLIDLRPAEAYLNKHVVGSKNIPFTQLLLHVKALKTAEKVILLAEPTTLPQAEEAYLVLNALGLKQVFVVPNGLMVCKMAKLSFTTLADARIHALGTWFTALPKNEKIPTVAGLVFIILSFFSGKRRGLWFGMGSTCLGFGLRNQLKKEQARSVGQWVLKGLLNKWV